MAAAIRAAARRHARRVTRRHDPFPGAPGRDPGRRRPSPSTRDAARVEVDLRDNPDCQPCGLNLTEATRAHGGDDRASSTASAHDVPPNAGSFRRIDVHLRENCVVGIPRAPDELLGRDDEPRRTASRTRCSGRIAELGEGFGMAEVGRLQPPALRRHLRRRPARAGGAVRQPALLAAHRRRGGGPDATAG